MVEEALLAHKLSSEEQEEGTGNALLFLSRWGEVAKPSDIKHSGLKVSNCNSYSDSSS